MSPILFFAVQLLLLENVRFYKEEEKNVPEFAKKVSSHIRGHSLIRKQCGRVLQSSSVSWHIVCAM